MQSIVRVLQEQLDQITRYLTNCRRRSGALAAINAISNQFNPEEVVALKKRVERFGKNCAPFSANALRLMQIENKN